MWGRLASLPVRGAFQPHQPVLAVRDGGWDYGGMKITKKPSGRESISTHEMRFQFGRVLQAVKAGRSLTLTYRSKPLARIVPLKPDVGIRPDDPVFRLHELAEPLGPLTNTEMDVAIYGQCFCIMKERGMRQALTTDEHFRKAGFSALLVD